VPLVDHGDFDWYDVEAVNLPNRIGLVVCDGPKGTTRGGRWSGAHEGSNRAGMHRAVGRHEQGAERAIIEQWCAELPAQVVEVSERYSAIKVGVTSPDAIK